MTKPTGAVSKKSSDETEERDLIRFLCDVDAEPLARSILPNMPPGPIKAFLDAEFLTVTGKESFSVGLSSEALHEYDDAIMDATLESAKKLVNEGQYTLALGRIQEGVRRLFAVLSKRGLNYDAIFLRAEQIKGHVASIAHGIGANDFTLEFSVGLSAGLTIGLHFKTKHSIPSA